MRDNVAIRKAVAHFCREAARATRHKPARITIEGRDYLRTDLFEDGVSWDLTTCVLYLGTWYAPAPKTDR